MSRRQVAVVAVAAACLAALSPASRAQAPAGDCQASERFTLAIHGGTVAAVGRNAHRLAFVRDQLEQGRAMLQRGVSAVDTVAAVVAAMEDSGLFNAGRGSIANQAGDIETDAAIMDGGSGRAGAIAAATAIRNPILAALLVMRRSKHVLMAGPRGEAFVYQLGAEAVEPTYFLHSGRNFSDVALPDDIVVAAPAPGLEARRAALLGIWAGTLAGRLNHVLVVERIDAEGADVLLAYGANEDIGAADGESARARATFRGLGGRELFARTARAEASYRLKPDGTLFVRLGFAGGGNAVGTLSHRDDLAGLGEHGTVGAIALDRCGDLAAGTSTGGFGSKTPGRVGDSPIVGAGTYAANDSAAISATGHGEYFMRDVAAHDIAARMRYGGQSLEEAAGTVIRELAAKHGLGGVIAVDRDGRVAAPFSTPGMIRGWVTEKTAPTATDSE